MDNAAPLLNQQIDLSYEVIRYNGSFMKENIYRQGPGPEVDAAWEALGVNCELSNLRCASDPEADGGDRSICGGTTGSRGASWLET